MESKMGANAWQGEHVLAAAQTLRKVLGDSGARSDQITVRIGDERGGHSGGGSTATASRRLVITIVADTQEEADEHGMQLQDQGCYCSSTGPTSVECDCSDVQ